MTDLALPIPLAPEGIDELTHLRSLHTKSAADAGRLVTELHELEHRDLQGAAADASTRLREVRHASSLLVEHGVDDQELLLNVYAGLRDSIEEAQGVIMRAELRDALRDDLEAVHECDPLAQYIGDLAGEAFVGFMLRQAGVAERYERARRGATVPIMHALVRAIAAGVVEARTRPLDTQDAEYRIDELLGKGLKTIGRVDPFDPLVDMRMAAAVRIALWNFVRISLRDDHGAGRRARHEVARREALRPIKLDTRPLLDQLGALPDYELAYDVGVGIAMVEPIIARRAELHDVAVPRRANVAAWWALFKSKL